jgi:hypothetical protein
MHQPAAKGIPECAGQLQRAYPKASVSDFHFAYSNIIATRATRRTLCCTATGEALETIIEAAKHFKTSNIG